MQVQTYFDITITQENFNLALINLALEVRPDWKSQSSNIKISDLNGGITNRLVACYLSQNGLNNSDTVLFRMYGKNTEKFISRQNEIENMKLMKEINLGPQFYLRFNNGIGYEFLPGNIVDQKLIYDETIFPKIAKAIAELNFVNYDISQDLDRHGKKPFIFPKIYQLLELVQEDYKANMPHMTESFLKTIPSLNALKEETKFLEDHLVKYSKDNNSLIAFCHNDLLLGNIIYDNSNCTVKFIDYEYGDYNYLAYDIANHFNEFAGVDEPDYSYFPNKEYQLKWLNIFLESFYKKLNEYYKETRFVLDDARLDQFYVEVNKFTLASHLMWAIWSLVQAQSSQLDFNFVQYSQIRFDQYFKNKKFLI